MDGLPVTLIVKAPNQQIEDQTIKCKETWTIHDLKGYLSEVYPCKPKKEEQKLIYSGQLLTDSVMLKDVLRRYEGQDTHTVHLVCSVPQNRYKKTSSNISQNQNSTVTSTAGSRENTNQPVNGNDTQNVDMNTNNPSSVNELRRRNVPDASTANTDQTSGQTNSNNNNSNNAHINYWQNQLNPSHNVNDPWRSNTVNPWTAYGYNPTNMMMSAPSIPVGNDPVAFAAAQMAWVQQMQVQYMQFYTQMMQNAGAGMVGFQPFLVNQQFQQNITEQQNAVNADQQAVNPQPNQNVVNNNAQPANELENWDWLEYFYLISRLVIMFAIIYFYSSPARFLLVLLTGFLIYLYQIRFFHGLLQNNEAENNNNEPANNNNNNAVVENQQQPQPTENVPAQDENNAENVQENNVAESNQNDETTLVQANNNQPSRLAITWTIITSFLTSLLPDAPNAI